MREITKGETAFIATAVTIAAGVLAMSACDRESRPNDPGALYYLQMNNANDPGDQGQYDCMDGKPWGIATEHGVTYKPMGSDAIKVLPVHSDAQPLILKVEDGSLVAADQFTAQQLTQFQCATEAPS